MRILTFLALLVVPTSAYAAEGSKIEPGEYEVEMRLELPHVDDIRVQKTSKVCVGDTGTHGIVVLSENNPLMHCPASNIKEIGDELTFDLICEGHNQAVARAKFQLSPQRFDGAFDMKMGGKNMTMIERQTGRRIGTCTNTPRF